MNLLYHHHEAVITIRVETGYLGFSHAGEPRTPEVLTLELRARGGIGSDSHSIEAADGMLKLFVPAIGDEPARSEFWPVERVRSVVVRGVS